MEEPSNSHNKKKKIIKKYNSTSHFYDKRYSRIQKEKYDIVLYNFRANGRLILDLGCGTGLFFEYITKFLTCKEAIKLNYVGVDISWNMLLEFKSKIVNIDLNNKTLNIILSDIDFLPFRDDIFHSVFALTSFQNLPHTKNVIKETNRVCRNNAVFKFSILRKNLNLDSVLSTFRSKPKHINITNNESLEDIVIEGIILKE